MSRIQKYYENKAVKYKIKDKRLENVFSLTTNINGKYVLDVGCGDGFLGSRVKKKGGYVYGIDISKKAILIAKKQLTEAKVVDLNEERLPFRNKYFDLVISTEVIEHLFDPSNFLKEINRVLKKNGELIITTPNILYWGNRLNFLVGKFLYTKEGVFDESHVHFFTYQTLINELNKSGFRVTDSKHVYPGANPFVRLKNIWPALFAYQLVFKARKIAEGENL